MLSATQNRAALAAIGALWRADCSPVAVAPTDKRFDHTPELGPLAIIWKLGRP